jgi:hypothetical protein
MRERQRREKRRKRPNAQRNELKKRQNGQARKGLSNPEVQICQESKASAVALPTDSF